MCGGITRHGRKSPEFEEGGAPDVYEAPGGMIAVVGWPQHPKSVSWTGLALCVRNTLTHAVLWSDLILCIYPKPAVEKGS